MNENKTKISIQNNNDSSSSRNHDNEDDYMIKILTMKIILIESKHMCT